MPPVGKGGWRDRCAGSPHRARQLTLPMRSRLEIEFGLYHRGEGGAPGDLVEKAREASIGDRRPRCLVSR